MSKIQIICTRPGMRRNGIEHPASQTYDAGRWTEEQLDTFRADPSFHVNIVEDGAVVQGDEFDKAVSFEVGRRLQAELSKLQADFSTSVVNASAERVEAAQARVRELEAELAKVPELIKLAVSEARAEAGTALQTKVQDQAAEITKLKAELKKATAKG